MAKKNSKKRFDPEFDLFLDKHKMTQQKRRYEMKTPPKLKALKQDLYDESKRLIFVAGLPSTGKTKCSIEAGIEQVLADKYDKLIISRPVLIPECGLLKGDMLDKMMPYIRQSGVYIDGCSQSSMMELITQGRVEIIPADLLQGNRFQNCFVVCDEFQNVPKSETFKVLTRVGEGCKFVILGDISKGQSNKKIKDGETLLDYCLKKFQGKGYATVHSFYEDNDILGDDVTIDIIQTLIPDFV